MTSTARLKKLRSSNYRLLGLVGQGQFGQVYCAIHRKTGRLVALKNLNRDRFPTHRFLREFRFLLSLNHPHIANCLALEQSETGRQLVLDYCEGGTLRDLLEQETQLTLAEILTLMTEVLEALEHAQQKNIVHCDIKPENILLTLTPDSWQAKVSDFGISRLVQEFKQDRTGATGSPAYMAPERFYYQYATPSDLYSVGVVLYELLMGDRPFSGSYNQLMVAHLNHAVKVPELWPEGVRSLLLKSLEKLMARRFRSAADMQSAILEVRKGLTAAELRDRFPKPLATIPNSTFTDHPSYTLPTACQTLTVLTQGQHPSQLLGAAENEIYRWQLTGEATLDEASPHQQWTLQAPVQQVLNTVNGAIAVSHTQLYQLSSAPSAPVLASLPDPIQIIPGGDRWLIARSQTTPHQIWLMDARSQVPKTPKPLTLAKPQGQMHLLALDQRHFIAADVIPLSTDLHLLTRWGKKLGKLHLQTPIYRLIPSQKPYRLLAQGGSQRQDLLVIHVKPFRVMRCRLDITADWLGELVIGFVVISAQGQLRLVNFQGQIIGQVDGLPVPRAIAFHPPHHIWLATQPPSAPNLYCIDIRTLDLDIIF